MFKLELDDELLREEELRLELDDSPNAQLIQSILNVTPAND